MLKAELKQAMHGIECNALLHPYFTFMSVTVRVIQQKQHLKGMATLQSTFSPTSHSFQVLVSVGSPQQLLICTSK